LAKPNKKRKQRNNFKKKRKRTKKKNQMKMSLKRDKESSRKSQDVLTPRKSIMLRACATIVITCSAGRAWRPNVHILKN
jgi:hypothetical protein